MNALEASRDRVREWKASSAAPIPGASVEQGTRAAMAGQGTWAAIAGQRDSGGHGGSASKATAQASMAGAILHTTIWISAYWGCKKNLNIEKITYKVVQMKFLAINITYQ